jgi:RNA polymerase sigma-70 factor (ECF subfamily)
MAGHRMASDDDRLSRIDTHWSKVLRAHAASDVDAREARQGLLSRYGGAVYRYLLAAVRDRETADDLFQEFSLQFLRGDFRRADPSKGRFRAFLKTALYHLIVDHQRQQRRAWQVKPLAQEIAADEEQVADQFTVAWRQELLARTWEGLKQRRNGDIYYDVLQLRVRQPLLSVRELAERLSRHRDQERPLNEGALRVLLHRARRTFALLLVEEIAGTLETANRGELEDELIELDLLAYCRPALDGR